MSTKFGEIDVMQILLNEYRIAVLEKILESIAATHSEVALPDKVTLESIRKDVVADLQKKYPKSGIAYTGGSDE